ncbi:Single-stranded-DNA-specific exonuclease RecJ protein [Marine Group I thaumarchaeote SCGC AAA799-E16]|uniref:Single-stranded-DNA-specific exonuclease RecJ protein n=4 Tax=Marine Group I TaxID=905826 RepID=A0A081RLG4_9ARCH|nr:Single-stranded-DNA-specific exonuclease RecJ protein [Marine Group I thaumarchaeote SCGC AAA799-N04]KER05674.1 Single-stranded-DNA-specific exonuclease RecJ protein [Marine Group I thaumarchaeote SCGC AAA799-E16]KFM15233.1 Single-stranded-DNA-specific exonuclease RecJ protein [Marine Group I thaumarchaeote SCGC AAA799-D11]KFM16431.1 Single-stranded-DNA-specific exonuclease RecJ protein [Marine Group I thaumarchaeote SCGC RSA3]
MTKSLDESLSFFKDKVSDCIRSKKSISVTTHIDCDGLTSGSIITKALIREGANCTVRTSKEFSKNVAESFKTDSRDFHIVTDLGGGFAKNLDEALGDNWIVLDHHQIPDEEIDNQNVINAWKYGIDGGLEICAGGMAYLASTALDEKNSDLSSIAVVSALGDRQDQGERKSFTGKNFEIANTAKELGLVEIDLDLLLVGRETRPLPDALAFTSQPFIEGLTWNRDACLSMLNSSGIQLKDGGRWRVPAELDEQEKRQVIESITKFTSGKNATEIMSELIGYTYTFPREDKRSFLRDGREFSTMLNSCGRINRSGVGMAICMGDRNKILREGETILTDYRKLIREYMNILTNERWRISESDTCVMVNGEDIVPETMTGTISSLIAGSPKNSGKIVILRTKGEENTIKFSSRKSFGCKSDINLSDLMRAGAEKFDGIGGGHDAAAGAKITKDKLDEFLNYLEVNVVNVSSAGSSQ